MKMGHTYADIELISTDDLALVRRGYLTNDAVRKVTVSALVDSGASMLSISETVRQQLGLATVGEGDVDLANGLVI